MIFEYIPSYFVNFQIAYPGTVLLNVALGSKYHTELPICVTQPEFFDHLTDTLPVEKTSITHNAGTKYTILTRYFHL